MAIALDAPESLSDDYLVPFPPQEAEQQETNQQETETNQPDSETEAATEETEPGEPDHDPDDTDVVTDGPVIDETDSEEPGVIAVPPGHAEERAQHEATNHDDEAFWRECELIGELAEASRECSRLELVLNELNEDRKEAKKEYEVSILKLRSVAAEVADMAKGLPTRPAKSPEQTTEADDQTTGAEESFDENAWRETATAELLKGAKGLGAKKLEAICDLAPTAGKLEDLRAEASKQHKSFKEMLPKGCGQGIADAIEDRLVEHVAKMGTPPASEQVEPRVEDGDAECDPDHRKMVDSLLEKFRDEASHEPWTIEDCEPKDDGERSGLDAYQSGEPAWVCEGDEDECESFVCGWVLGEWKARLEKEAEDSKHEDVEDDPDVTAKASDNLEDL